MAQEQIAKEEQSLGTLFSELASETSLLVRQEVTLAKTELAVKATSVGKNVGFLAVGGLVGYTAVLSIVAAVIIGLANFIPAWAAALIVGVIVGIIAAVLIMAALKSLKETNLTPKETVESIKEDAQWLKNQVS